MIDKEILDTIANETPCYIHIKEIIKKRFQFLQEIFPGKILYSLKANPAPEVIKELKVLGAHFDVSSKKEINIVLQEGVDPQNISFVGPGKLAQDIEYAIQRNIGIIVVESIQEMDIISKKSESLNKISSILIRVNLKRYYNANGRESFSIPSQFGIDEEQLPTILQLIKKKKNIKLIGIHNHCQSQILNPDHIASNFANTVLLSDKIDKNFPVVNLGGGLGIPYFENQKEINLNYLRSKIIDFPYKDKSIYLESGRFILGPAGFFITKILYSKTSQKKKFLIVDGGLSNHLAAIGFGQVIKRNFKITLLTNRIKSEQMEKYTIAGPSCYSLDIIGRDVPLNSPREGDYICIHNSGAYGATFSPQSFLGQRKAKEFYF